jgi:hypothetical protein
MCREGKKKRTRPVEGKRAFSTRTNNSRIDNSRRAKRVAMGVNFT